VAIEIEIVGDSPTLVSGDTADQRVLTISTDPVVINGSDNSSVVVEVLKGLPGDDKIFVGDTPPDNPTVGQIWINTGG